MKKLIITFLTCMLIFAFSGCSDKSEKSKMKKVEATQVTSTKFSDNFKLYSFDFEKKAIRRYKYIGNKNSKKFHVVSCKPLPKEKNRVYFFERSEAIDNSFIPCKKCNP